MMRRAGGFTLLELLVVLGILGGLLTLAFVQFRQTEAQQAKASFITSIQRLFWETSTAAASRGITLTLERKGDRLLVYPKGHSDKVYRSLEIPSGVTVHLPEGVLADFTPPGRIKFKSIFPKDCNNQYGFKVTNDQGQSRCYQISYIGEVKEILQ